MKKLKLLTITMFIFFFGILNVDAMTLKPSGATSGKRGEQIIVYVTLNKSSEEKNISAVEGKFLFDSDVLTIVSTESLMGSSWTELSGINNNGTFSYANFTYNALITSTSKNIVKIVFKISDNASYGNTTISVSNTDATDEVGGAVSISGGSHTVKVLSDINTLTGLSVSGATFAFDENTTTYDLELNSESVNIEATKKDSGSTVSGDTGNKTLKYGLNTFKITVKSESGSEKTYTVNITRPDTRNKDNSLSSLKLSEGNIKFNKDTTTYNVKVKSNIEKIKVDAILTDEKASFVSGYGSREVKLNLGKNVIEVRVKAENESVKTYKINITREDNRSDNNYLSDLTLDNGKISFDKKQFEYKVTVLYEVEKVEVTAKTEHENATYKVEMPEKLEVGENTIIVKVTAENGSIKEYKIIVERKEESEELSNNNSLSSLTILGYEINFKNNVYEYNLKINDEEKLTINYQQEDESSEVVIKGNENLQNGSVISINVTSELGVTAVYKINIEKEGNGNLILYIAIGAGVLLILTVIIIISSNKNNRSRSIARDNFDNMAVKQNTMDTQSITASNGMQNVQNIQNMIYTVNPNMKNTQTTENVENNQNNNFF